MNFFIANPPVTPSMIIKTPSLESVKQNLGGEFHRGIIAKRKSLELIGHIRVRVFAGSENCRTIIFHETPPSIFQLALRQSIDRTRRVALLNNSPFTICPRNCNLDRHNHPPFHFFWNAG